MSSINKYYFDSHFAVLSLALSCGFVISGRKLKTQIAFNLQPTGSSVGSLPPFKLSIYEGQVGVLEQLCWSFFSSRFWEIVSLCSPKFTSFLLWSLWRNLYFLLLFSENHFPFFPAVCHVPQSAQLCVLFLEEQCFLLNSVLESHFHCPCVEHLLDTDR